MRSWIGAISVFGAVVISETLRMPFQNAVMPARPKSPASVGAKYQGCLRPDTVCHSYKPLAGTTQRQRRKASRDAGLSASDSPRAFGILLPRPQRYWRATTV